MTHQTAHTSRRWQWKTQERIEWNQKFKWRVEKRKSKAERNSWMNQLCIITFISKKFIKMTKEKLKNLEKLLNQYQREWEIKENRITEEDVQRKERNINDWKCVYFWDEDEILFEQYAAVLYAISPRYWFIERLERKVFFDFSEESKEEYYSLFQQYPFDEEFKSDKISAFCFLQDDPLIFLSSIISEE